MTQLQAKITWNYEKKRITETFWGASCLDIVQNESMVYKKEGEKWHFFVADKYI